MIAVLVAPVAAILLLGAAALLLWWQRSSQRGRLIGRAMGPLGASAPRVLHFTAASCTVCHVAQRPALRRLSDAVVDLDIDEIDVAADPGTARAYGVMTLPTTVVLDRDGRVTAVNAGFASEAVLREQVEAARHTPAEPAVA